MVVEIAGDIALLNGVAEALSYLEEKGVSLHLLSGSIDVVISEVLGEHERFFKTIKFQLKE